MKVPGEKKVLCGLCNNEYSYLGTTGNICVAITKISANKAEEPGVQRARNKLAWILSLLTVSARHCVQRKLQN